MLTFSGEATEVIGIDENGYGPILGPLVVTALKMDVRGDPWENLKLKNIKTPIKDSKEIFKHTKRAYKRGETFALAILNRLNIEPTSFYQYVEQLTRESITEFFKNCEPLLNLMPDFSLPVWSTREKIKNLELFESPYLEIKDVKQKVLMPYEFNLKLESLKSKALLDFTLFINLMKELASQKSMGIFGKISGKIYYRKWFNFLGFKDIEVIVERSTRSRYRLNSWELSFFVDADSSFINVAMASILGKYTRELFLYSLSLGPGFNSTLPIASGYRHDPKTSILKEALEKSGIPEKCYLRVK